MLTNSVILSLIYIAVDLLSLFLIYICLYFVVSQISYLSFSVLVFMYSTLTSFYALFRIPFLLPSLSICHHSSLQSVCFFLDWGFLCTSLLYWIANSFGAKPGPLCRLFLLYSIHRAAWSKLKSSELSHLLNWISVPCSQSWSENIK